MNAIATPLTAEELTRCAALLRRDEAFAAGGLFDAPPIVIVTFVDRYGAGKSARTLSGAGSVWRLGASSAHFGVPLLLVGLGLPRLGGEYAALNDRKKWVSWLGLRRAIQLVRELYPVRPPLVAFADGFDVEVVNRPPSDAAASGGHHHHHHGGLLVGAECNSWPRCFRGNETWGYRADASYARCTGRSSTCFLNAGVLVGAVDVWRELLERALLPMLPLEQRNLLRDQDALHQIFMALAAPAAGKEALAAPAAGKEACGERGTAAGKEARGERGASEGGHPVATEAAEVAGV